MSNTYLKLVVSTSALIGLTFPFSASAQDLELDKGNVFSSQITVEGMMLRRSKVNTIPLTMPDDVGDIGFSTDFDTSGLSSDLGAGIRIGLSGELFDIPLHLSGFYAGNMLARQSKINFADGTSAVYADEDNISDINFRYSDDIYGMTIEHQTNLWSLEANAEVFGVSGLAIGVRGFYLQEKLSSSTYDDADDFPNNPGFSDNDIDQSLLITNNHLLGLQVGYEKMFAVMDGVSIGGSVKAGVYGNWFERDRGFTSRSPSSSPSGRSRVRDTIMDFGTAYGLEVNPRLSVELIEGVKITASGALLWLDGISEATSYFDNVANRQDMSNKNDGDIFFYGGAVGLTVELGALSSMAFATGDVVGSQPEYHISATPAELDERISELEANAARKGNSRMSLKVRGQVNTMLMAFNDGEIKDLYIVDNNTSGTRISFSGLANFSRAWTAGYKSEINLRRSVRSSAVSQRFDSDPDSEDIDLRKSEMWLRRRGIGRLTLGLTSPATDNIISANLGGTGGVASSDVRLIGGGVELRRGHRPDEDLQSKTEALIDGFTVNDFLPRLDTQREDGVRFDSARVSGARVSAFLGGDDLWDISLNYKGGWRDWLWRFNVGYLEESNIGGVDRKEIELKGSAAIKHVPSGLYLNAAYIHHEFEGTASRIVTEGFVTTPGSNIPDFKYGYLQAGIQKNWFGAGATSFFGEYAFSKNALNGRDQAGFDEVTSSELKMLGFGVVQKIDKVGAEIYAGYRGFGFDVHGVERNPQDIDTEMFDNIDIVYAGMRVKF